MKNEAQIVYDKGYRSDQLGNVIGPNGHKRKFYLRKDGYFTFSANINGRSKAVYVHQLVAFQKFGNKAFENNIEVRHLNGNSTDNTFGNIEIGNRQDNAFDIPKEKRIKIAINAAKKLIKFSDEQILQIREDHKNGLSYNKIVLKYGMSKGNVSSIIRRKTRKEVIAV